MKKIIVTICMTIGLLPKVNAQNPSSVGKTTCACMFAPLLLIPYGSGVRVGWLNVAIPPFPISLPTYSVFTNVSSSYVNTGRIRNPGLYGGLPIDFPGLSSTSLTGICLNSGSFDNILTCGTMTVGSTAKHYLLAADKVSPAVDFTVSSAIVVNASFAPASSGWILSHIDGANGTTVYGMFTNPSSTSPSTYLASIDVVTGVATPLHYWATTRFAALDVSPSTPGTLSFSKASLLDFSTSSIVEFDFGSFAITYTPLPITLTGSTGGFGVYNYFLSNGYYYPCYYPGSPSAIYTPTVPYPASSTIYEMYNMTSAILLTNPITGAMISDIAPQH